jgi:hypothetical protein
MGFDYYHAKVMAACFNANLCAYCAGSTGTERYGGERLTQEWRSVLPVCLTCRADGALPVARTKRRNGDAINRMRLKRSQWTKLQVAWLLPRVWFLQHVRVWLGVDAVGVSQ